ncbi:MAG: DUF1800 domain-containing protein [Ignavibacteriae bacterium]|nr:DUF1800 domain-containing protein [Ignavibacteriota bacterium]MCB9214372.1 DUF1800 domain-containing protein [Ignavibacteria bacterium]
MDRRAFLTLTQQQTTFNRNGEASLSIPDFTETPSLQPYEDSLGRQDIYHLLRRTLVAPSRTDIEQSISMTLEELVDQLLDDSASLPGPPRFVSECLNASALYWDSGRTEIIDTFFDELRRWWLLLMTNSRLSARERLTLFWHNHFSVNARVVQDSRYIYLQNQLFRRHALGNFKTLVADVTKDKAMLLFLDGKNNKANYRNENYARELQELFTIGIADNDGSPNYTQEDVVEAAKALTGWDWVGLGMQGDVASNLLTGHDLSDKVLYGEKITGQNEGGPELSRLLDIIFSKEETARYVIRKLYRFLVYTDTTLTPVRPIPAIVEENIIAPLAAEFRDSNWEITPVLKRLLMSRHFYDPAIRGAMIKSPVDLFVSLMRSTLVDPLTGDPGEFAGQYAQDRATELGQNLFHPPGVQGWQFYRSWISSSTLPKRHFYTDELLYGVQVRIVDRLNLVFTGPINRDGTWKVDVLSFGKQFTSFDEPEEFVRDVAEHMLAFPASEQLLDRLLAELVEGRAYEWPDLSDEIRTTRIQKMLRYLMRSTNFQLM